MERTASLTRFAVAAIAALTIASAAPAYAADGDEGGAAAAESLFQEGRKLGDAHKYAEACPKFLASYKLSPAVGTLLNLADCYEKNGQLASAWVRFREAIALAQRGGRADREKTAKARADKLEPRLIRLTIVSASQAVDVKLDGNALDPGAIGTPMPVDHGKHAVEASAKGKKTFSTTIDVSERAKSPSIEIPALEDEAPAAAAPAAAAPTATTKPPPGGEKKRSDGSTQRILGLVGMGAGVVGVGVGAFFGIRTSSLWDEAKTHCTGIDCDPDGVVLATDAKNAGNISTVAFIAGGVLLVGGAVLFFTAPSAERSSGRASKMRVGVGPGSVSLGGTF